MVLMSTHKLFLIKNKKNRYTIVLLYQSGGLRGYTLHGHVTLIRVIIDDRINI